MKQDKLSITVVVPVYNSEKSLPELCSELAQVLPQVAAVFEVILVNDGSSDGSWHVVQGLARTHEWLRGMTLTRNYGQHNALLCGIREARYDVIVTMDDDLQHPASEIPRLLAKMDEGYDVVYGAPEQREHGVWHNLGSHVLRWALRVAMGIKSARDVSAFRAFRAGLRPVFVGYHSPHISIDVLLSWATVRFAAVTVQHRPRQYGRSNYNVVRLVLTGFNMLTGFSTLPLQFASLVGFAFMLFGVGVLVYVVGRYLMSGSVPGFPFLASIIAIFSGVQLFALGIIGEYLARMFFRTMDRPMYLVREHTPQAAHHD
ncbi:MAG: glycosyltransferase family 2 protein [Bryobacteraceae bacterium]|jgi:undecaprenyl-phosphate 4-deoxy-4-formamido-L-arabinose transferase